MGCRPGAEHPKVLYIDRCRPGVARVSVGWRSGGGRVAVGWRRELALLADAAPGAETGVSPNRVSMRAFAKASGNTAATLRRVGPV
jgi:hypothetical protein